MHKKYIVVFLLGTAVALAAGAQVAGVSLTGSNPPSVIYGNTGALTWISGTVTVTKDVSTVTNVVVDLEPASTSPGNSKKNRQSWKQVATATAIKLDYAQVFFSPSTNGNVIKQWDKDSNVTSSNVYFYVFPAGSATGTSTTFTYYMGFYNAASLAPGTYERLLTFRARLEPFPAAGTYPTTTPVATLDQIVSFVVSPTASLTFLAGTTGTTTTSQVAFGEVVSTTTQNFRVRVQSNFRYSLTVASEYGRVLRHASYDAAVLPVNETIPYTLIVNGLTLPAGTSPLTVASLQQATGTTFREYSASVTLNDITSYTAGSYSDKLRFTVTAQ